MNSSPSAFSQNYNKKLNKMIAENKVNPQCRHKKSECVFYTIFMKR